MQVQSGKLPSFNYSEIHSEVQFLQSYKLT